VDDPLRFSALAAALLASGIAIASLRPAWVVGHPRSVLLILAALTTAALFALIEPEPLGLRLRIDPSTESLLPTDDPATEVYRETILDFGDDQIFVIAMETDGIFTVDNLQALRRVHDGISKLDGIRSVKSLSKVTAFRYDPVQEWIEVRPFIEEIPEDPESLAALRDRAVADPVFRQNLVSLDARTAALNVSFREMTDAEFIDAGIDGQILAVLDRESREGRRFYVSGRPHIKSVMYHAMLRDLKRLIPVALLVVAAALVFVTGSIRGVVLPLATVALAVIWTFAAIAFLGRPLSVLTVLLAPTLVAVGSAYGVHVVSRYGEERAAGGDRDAVVLRTLKRMRIPVLIAGFTTMVGFAALMLTEVPAVFEIGAFSVFGVASVTLLSITGLPAVLALTPLRASPFGEAALRRVAAASNAALDALLVAIGGVARRWSGSVLAVFGLVTLAALAMIPRIEIDTDYLSFFDARAEVRRDFEAINRLLAGAIPLFVVVEGPGPGYLRGPEVLRGIEALQRRLDELPGASRTLSFIDTLRILNRAVSADDPAEERIPATRAGVSELLFLLPKGDLARFATVDQAEANLIVRTGEVGSASVRRLTDGIESLLQEAALPGAPRTYVTGNALLLTRAADGVAAGQPLTVGFAALAIFILLSAGLRSLGLGLVAMLPNVVPVLIFFGALGAGTASLSLPTSLIGSVALGIAIDATAHFLVRYRDERDAGLGPEEAAQRCVEQVGRPIAIATATLFLGFASVCFSEFATLREFGALSAMTMLVCSLTDLLLLPALLIRLRL
jgi:predicted RND superfamily exporter protein